MTIHLTYSENENDFVAAWAASHLPYVGNDGFGPCIAMSIMDDQKRIGAVVYHRYMGYDCEMSIYTESPKWAQKGIIKRIFDYPFEQLNVRRVTSTIAVDNYKAQRLVQRLGFVKEGHLRLGFGDQDAILYGLLRNERRF
ncbi:MAG: GNAT family N-acetyltransferase [Alphaproteobacteria bacterium]|jgi:RimJ/RimL family protein N-acetyltransferase|nr:GNAT family N-acetyltransferase [Alphaproteobacteria bacterium]MBP9878215.1 GNAT family N-acetyltransferase [Alphaproteobacteria bacterium]